MTNQPDSKAIPPAPAHAVDDEDPSDVPMQRKPKAQGDELREQIRKDNERIQKGAP